MYRWYLCSCIVLLFDRQRQEAQMCMHPIMKDVMRLLLVPYRRKSISFFISEYLCFKTNDLYLLNKNNIWSLVKWLSSLVVFNSSDTRYTSSLYVLMLNIFKNKISNSICFALTASRYTAYMYTSMSRSFAYAFIGGN